MYPCNPEVLRWQYVTLTEYQFTNVCIQHWVKLHIQSTCLRRSFLKQDQGQRQWAPQWGVQQMILLASPTWVSIEVVCNILVLYINL